MDYEKILKEALNNKSLPFEVTSWIEEQFPQLVESEDEKNKRILRSISSKMSLHLRDIFTEEEFQCFDAWLEKQGKKESYTSETMNEKGDFDNGFTRMMDKEQKPIDKVEPKFKVGDTVKDPYGDLYHIIEIMKDSYKTDDGRFILFKNEDAYSLWTIQDAKDGDVLATLDYILIFKKILPKDGGVSYCHYDFGSSTPQFNFNEDDNWYFGKEAKIYPATKEQRDLLFQKMKENGYEWDADKKELKKIEQIPWSEEDEDAIGMAIIALEDMYDEDAPNTTYGGHNLPFNKAAERLKSLKERVQLQPKQEWSDEDEQLYNDLSDTYFYNDEDYPEETYKLMLKRVLDWMTKRAKSLRPQSHWKPQKKQIVALRYVLNHLPYCTHKEEISGLLDQIKDL